MIIIQQIQTSWWNTFKRFLNIAFHVNRSYSFFGFIMSNQDDFSGHRLKQLLQDIEAHGGIAVFRNLKGLCDRNPQVYGTKGSPLRRQVQKKYARLRDLPIKRYNILLQEYGVQPSSSRSSSQHRAPPSSPDSVSSEESFQFLSPPRSHTMSHHQLVMKLLSPYHGKSICLLSANLLCFLTPVHFRGYGMCSKLCHWGRR